jgi:phospholipid/cholesterol/gamma-HCH transport system ATP-binding protein
MSCIVELKNIFYSAQNRKLCKGISYEFEEGKTTALVGPSGCGKSTMLKLSAGLFAPDEGEVLFRGKDIFRMNRLENLSFRREAAVVFQDSALWANQNLFQILDLPLRLHFPAMTKQQREKRIEFVVSEVGYKKDLGIRPSALSMGEQKLLAFARAIICRPMLLYLDEWTESLDETASQRLIDIVKKMQAAGVSIIFVSHDIRIINSLADYVIMILGGQIFVRITKEQIKADDFLVEFIEKGMEA